MYTPGTVLHLLSGNVQRSSDLFERDPEACNVRALGSRAVNSAGDIIETRRTAARLVYRVQIVEAYLPYTMSVVCRVRLTAIFDSPTGAAPFIPLPADAGQLDFDPSAHGDCDPGSPEYILKLYDRRHFSNIRNAEGEQYTEKSARAYHKYLEGNPAPYFTRWFWDMPGLSEGEEMSEGDLALYEAWLEASARRMWEKEVSAYHVLANLQGRSVPRLVDTVSCATTFPFDDHSFSEQDKTQSATEAPEIDSADAEPFRDQQLVLGILLEFIPGISLRPFIDRMLRCKTAPKKEILREIANIGDEAVSLIRTIGEYPLLNRDVRIDNMLVRQSYVDTLFPDPVHIDRSAQVKPPSDCLPRCVAIDFGHSRLRFADETDEQWRCAKLNADEEDNLGRYYQGHMLSTIQALRESGGTDCEEEDAWQYTSSMRWWRALTPAETEEYHTKDAWGEHPESWR